MHIHRRVCLKLFAYPQNTWRIRYQDQVPYEGTQADLIDENGEPWSFNV